VRPRDALQVVRYAVDARGCAASCGPTMACTDVDTGEPGAARAAGDRARGPGDNPSPADEVSAEPIKTWSFVSCTPKRRDGTKTAIASARHHRSSRASLWSDDGARTGRAKRRPVRHPATRGEALQVSERQTGPCSS
jgi:hypothetical protein